MLVVMLIVSLAAPASGLHEIKFPFNSMLACEEYRVKRIVQIAEHFGQVLEAKCVLVEQGV